ncbi:MAG TPA: type II toxin-antitoxin system VapC family toxin [Acidobacteriota bacterium]|nr:type II toxin-antitoxin system VapC family toxin [Acidobacteriota bacterium]
MITAVDTNVLLDVFTADRQFLADSRRALRASMAAGSLIACDVVWAELGASFPRTSEAASAMRRIGVEFVPLDESSGLEAGAMWREYRQRGGSRRRMIADFLIGAHAATTADRLLTRDRGFYSSYFSQLRLIDPATTLRHDA